MERENARVAVEAQWLLGLTTLLIEERPISEVLDVITTAPVALDGVDSAAVLMPDGDGLSLVASAGQSLSSDEIDALIGDSGRPTAIGLASASSSPMRVLSLVADGRPLGMLVLRGAPHSAVERDALTTLTSQVSLMVERALLRVEALQAESLQRENELRRALLATTAHDLCGPLATMKVATSTFCDSITSLPAVDQAELCQLLDAQVDHMTRLVTGLLDLARSEAGVLAVRAETRSVSDLLHETVRLLALGDRRVEFAVPEVLPLVAVDPLLIKQVIANLLENANRYSPPGTPIIIAVTNPPNTAVMEVSVTDHGVGLPLSQCGGLFDPFVRQGEGGRAGLGLAIAKAFVEAHRQRLWAENVSPSGARFVFTIPIARQEDAYE